MRPFTLALLAPLALLAGAALLTAPGAAGARPAARTQAVSYAPGWNLVAGPQGAQLIGATGQLYTLQPGNTGYVSQPANGPLTACVGYWAYFPQGGSMDPGSLGAATVNCALNISPAQFVMMGNPSATASVPVNGADLVYTYTPDAGYQSATRLDPGQGAWVYAAGAVSISTSSATNVPASAASSATPQPAAEAGEEPVGPLALSASLSVTTCEGGRVGVTVHVLDANGDGVAGATVTGMVQYQTTSESFSFPPTDAGGTTSTEVETPNASGGYTVQWTFMVTAGGLSASGSASCVAPS